jgi:hypothetical protein
VGVILAMLALFVVALGIFLIPFAFPTPPPIVTRFQATPIFSPNADSRRDQARVNVRLHEASTVTVDIVRDGRSVKTLLDAVRRPRGTVSVTWDGRDRAGVPAPDGTYTIRLRVRAGKKQFNTSRKLVLDTVGPRPEKMTVVSATLDGPGPGECRTTFASADDGGVRFEAHRPGARQPVRRLGNRPVKGGSSVRWLWDGRDARGRAVPPGLYVIRATLGDAARNVTVRERTCWVGRLAGRAVPAHPSPRERVGVALRRTDGTALPPATPVSLTLRRRAGEPGLTPASPLGAKVGVTTRGRAGSVRVRLPAGINPAALWLVASTLDGQATALIDLRRG